MLIYSSTHLRWLFYCTSALFGDVVMFSGEIRKRCSFILMNAVCCLDVNIASHMNEECVSVCVRLLRRHAGVWAVFSAWPDDVLREVWPLMKASASCWQKWNGLFAVLDERRAFVKLRFEQLIKYRTILKSFSKSCVFYCSFSDTPCALQLLKSVFDKSRLN